MSLENIIKSLENGICPLELNYKPREEGDVSTIDWDKVRYNLTYKQPEFYEQKFPPECAKIPGFDQVIDLIINKNYDNSPLKEILERQDELIELQEEASGFWERSLPNNKIEINTDDNIST
jgi:hypothetical protein